MDKCRLDTDTAETWQWMGGKVGAQTTSFLTWNMELEFDSVSK